MLVPHGSGKTRQINLRLSVLLLALFTWTGITFWGSYLSAQHIDYWKTQMSNHVLRMKVAYLISQIDNTRGLIDEVKQVDAQLRQMLQLDKTAPAKNAAATGTSPFTGGPTLEETESVTRVLSNAQQDVSWQRLVGRIQALKSDAEIRLSSYDQINRWIDDQRKLFNSTPTGWPCVGHRTSHFGKRVSPFTGLEEFHFGVDIAGAKGTPIRATADGRVRVSSWMSGYGNIVVIQHDYGYSTRYAHNSKNLARVGDRVKRGQVIALVGNTGKSSGPHCHYEVWRYNKRENPYSYMINIEDKKSSLRSLIAAAPVKTP